MYACPPVYARYMHAFYCCGSTYLLTLRRCSRRGQAVCVYVMNMYMHAHVITKKKLFSMDLYMYEAVSHFLFACDGDGLVEEKGATEKIALPAATMLPFKVIPRRRHRESRL